MTSSIQHSFAGKRVLITGGGRGKYFILELLN